MKGNTRLPRSSSPHGSYSDAPQRSPYRSTPPSDRCSTGSSSPRRYSSNSGAPPARDRPNPQAKFTAEIYVQLAEFQREVHHGFFARVQQMSDSEKRQRFGSLTVPIHVPLAPGESKEQYEQRFCEWLQVTQGLTLAQVRKDPNIRKERFCRLQFSTLNVRGQERFGRATDRGLKRERSPSTNHASEEGSDPPPSKKSSLDCDQLDQGQKREEPPSFVTQRPAAVTCQEPVLEATSAPSSYSLLSPPPSAAPSDVRKCPSVSPVAGNLSSEAVLDAYMVCGCKACLLRGVRQLAGRVSELERSCRCGKAPQGGVKIDLICDDDTTTTQSPKNQFSGSAAAAITRLVLSKPTPRDLYAQAHLTTSEAATTSEDSVKKQLLAAYDAVNECIVVNEKVLEASATQLATTPITDIQETTRLQDENHELRQLIQDEMDKRNAALAMLIVYLWRHECEDLKRLVQDKAACNVLHVQRTSHHKCAKLSTAIAAARGRIETIKKALDAVMVASSTGSGDERMRLRTLSQLGEKLTTAEEELNTLATQRRREFVTLIHFDERVRVLVETLLAQALL